MRFPRWLILVAALAPLGAIVRAEEWTNHLATWAGVNYDVVLPEALTRSGDPLRDGLLRRVLPGELDFISCFYATEPMYVAVLAAPRLQRNARLTWNGFYAQRDALKAILARPEKLPAETRPVIEQRVAKARAEGVWLPDLGLYGTELLGEPDESDSHVSFLLKLTYTQNSATAAPVNELLCSFNLLYVRGKALVLLLYHRDDGKPARELMEDVAHEVVRRTLEANKT
jgi:hypothetical protein